MNKIKTKQSNQTIKAKDSKENLTHFIKHQTIHNRENSKDEQSSPKANASAKATDTISSSVKTTAYESGFRAKKYIKRKIEQHQTKKRMEHSIAAITSNNTSKATYVSKAKRYIEYNIVQDQKKV